jgi:hypothetical protein
MGLNTRVTRRFLTAVALVGSGAGIAGCGGSSNKPANIVSASTGSSHKTISLTRAADLSSDAAGYKLDMVMAETVSGQTINISANGSYTPKSHEASMTMDMALPAIAGGEQQFQMVLANDTLYMKFPTALTSQIPYGKPWMSFDLHSLSQAANLPGLGSLIDSSSTLSDPGEYLDFLRAATAGSVIDDGQETVGGVQTTHYQAELQFSKLPDALPAADRSSTQQLINGLESKAKVPNFPADVWIDGSGLVRRIMMNMKETVLGHQADTQVTENFSDYGTQPPPTIPAAAQTTNLMSLVKAGG